MARSPAMFRVAIVLLLPLVLTQAQMPATNGMPNSNSGQNSNNSGNSNSNSNNAGTRGPGREGGSYLSGRVVVADGGELPADVTVRRSCGSRITAQAHADGHGYFVLSSGVNDMLLGDASSPGVFRSADNAPSAAVVRNRNAMPNTTNDCEIRAVAQGYRSEGFSLAGWHPGDSEDIGVLMLHRQVGSGGYATSATTSLAPKNARRFYRKGLKAIQREGPDEAQKDFLSAVQSYPRFAEAWYELGRIYDQRMHTAEARAAYTKAIAADSSYAKPYEQLAALDLREHQWAQAAERSGRVLGLDPYDFPRAYYLNAVANFEIRDLRTAERSARRAVELEEGGANPEVQYILGMILAEEGQLTEAAADLRAFLDAGQSGDARANARRMLARIERSQSK